MYFLILQYMEDLDQNQAQASEALWWADSSIDHTTQATHQRASEALASLRLKYGWYSLNPEDYLLTPAPDKERSWITNLLDVQGRRTWHTIIPGREPERYDMGSINRIMGDILTAHIARAWGRLPDDFFDYLIELTREYGESKWDAMKHSSDAVLNAQVFAAQKHPYILKDPRSMKFFEALANFPYKHPYSPFSFNQFVGYTWETWYFLLLGFWPEHIDPIWKIVSNDNIWNGSNKEFKRVWLSSLAELVEHLTPWNESKTAPIRLELIKRNPWIAEIRSHTIHSFSTPEDNKVLDEMINAIPIPKIEPKWLALYYDALCWYGMNEWKTRQLAFESIHNLHAKWDEMDDFSGYIPWRFSKNPTKRTGQEYQKWRYLYINARNDYLTRNKPLFSGDPWTDKWVHIEWEDELNRTGDQFHKAWRDLRYTVTKNYFEVLWEIRDRVKWMIEECWEDICTWLLELVPQIERVLEMWKTQKWDEEEGWFLYFDIQVAIDLAKLYEETLKKEKSRLEDMQVIAAHNSATNKIATLEWLKDGWPKWIMYAI